MDASALRQHIEHALDAVRSRAPAPTLWIALSGGGDSMCLLSLAAFTVRHHANITLRAVHVHHGLQQAADHFEATARQGCEQLGVPLEVHRVTPDTRAGVEVGARDARYAVFESLLSPGDTLWMAHHQCDQAETLLYRLMRGSGVRGLAGIPPMRPLGQGWLERPLLAIDRSAIETYLVNASVRWCDDPTNADDQFDRNYLRHRIMVPLSARWPAASEQMARSASHLREAVELLDELAADELARLGGQPQELPQNALLAMHRARQRLVIEGALRQLGLPPPPRARLESLLDQLEQAAGDRQVYVAWPGAQARLWRERLYLLGDDSPGQKHVLEHWSQDWDGVTCLETPHGPLCWQLRSPNDRDVKVTLGPRRGGERLYLNGLNRPLKKLLQERAVPPWQRHDLVLVWHDETLVAVMGALSLSADGWQLTPQPVISSGRCDRQAQP